MLLRALVFLLLLLLLLLGATLVLEVLVAGSRAVALVVDRVESAVPVESAVDVGGDLLEVESRRWLCKGSGTFTLPPA
jgi:hypothetical protein